MLVQMMHGGRVDAVDGSVYSNVAGAALGIRCQISIRKIRSGVTEMRPDSNPAAIQASDSAAMRGRPVCLPWPENAAHNQESH